MSKSSPGNWQKIFSSDQAICKLREDKLDRRGFAESMAAAIRGRKGDESLCLALYGQWGSGKTSIKNMIVESLRKSKISCPIIVEFNPWQWSGQEQLITAFFLEIGLALGEADPSTEGKKRASLFKHYATALTLGSAALKGVRFVAPLFGIPAEPVLEPVQKVVDTLKENAEALEQASPEPDKPLQVRKAELAASLRETKNPILIVLDDIDRLVPEEIRLLFRLVKANADFPNVTYLMLFHRGYVEGSLEGGRAYMEKIIQVGFEVPKIEGSRLRELLDIDLHKIAKKNSLDEFFESQYSRWNAIFLAGARPFFRTVREIKRFTSNLAFYMGMFRNAEIPEINPVDLMAVQVLAVFEPDVYHALHSAKEFLTADHTVTTGEEGRVEKIKLGLAQITHASREESREHVEEILKQLFPVLNIGPHGVTFATETRDSIIKNIRICDHDFFDRYFYLDILSGDISQKELVSLYRIANDATSLVASLKTYIDKGLFDVLFDRLESNLQYLEAIHARSFMTALFDLGESIFEVKTSFEVASAEKRVAKLVRDVMRTYDDEKDVIDAYTQTQGIIVPLITFSEYIARGLSSPQIATLEFASKIQDLCLHRINMAAQSGALCRHPQMVWILMDWQRIQSEGCKQWLAKQIVTKDGLLHILEAFTSKRLTTHRGEVQRTNLEVIRHFIPIEDIKRLAKSFDWSNESSASQRIIEAWLKACEGNAEEEIL